MASREFFSTKRRTTSPMTQQTPFEGSGDHLKAWQPYVGFDIETYSPNCFPENGGDPIVTASLAISTTPDLRDGLMLASLIYPPSKEEALLERLYTMLSHLNEGSLVTYNGRRFDVPYVTYRGMLNGIDFGNIFSTFRHVDLYEAVKRSGIRFLSYSQKAVEQGLGIERVLPDLSGAKYHVAFDGFNRTGDLRPLIYNIEDSMGCLHILNRLRKVGVSVALSR